ncbi:MAG: hypothetical protein R3C49_09790 [Planctomycetaceae bacterium]
MGVSKTRAQSSDQPFGKILGLLAGSIAVMVGIWRGVSPETVLVRAMIVGFVTAVGARTLISVLKTFFAEDDD